MNRPPVLERVLSRLEEARKSAVTSKMAEVIAFHIAQQGIILDWNKREKSIVIYKPFDTKVH